MGLRRKMISEDVVGFGDAQSVSAIRGNGQQCGMMIGDVIARGSGT